MLYFLKGPTIKVFVFLIIACFLFALAGLGFAQDEGNNAGMPRGSIPEDLLRPQRGEAPRYAIDTAIGPLGRGSASQEAYQFARRIAEALLGGNMEAPSLSAMNIDSIESCMSALEPVSPRNFRLGGGRGETDGSVSFLIRFLGREQVITGELYIRREESKADEGGRAQSRWIFEDLILENPKNRTESEKTEQRFDFPPYERFF
ncbi:MAG: hypothetical protein LBH43_17500 [Treponema sp.]|jgi:hypothetical protein|nr:hypothetical protein [Treponema sp.]